MLFAGCSLCGILGEKNLQPFIRSAIELRFEHRYAKADSIFLDLQKKYTGDPAPYFLRASNLHDKMLHCEDFERIGEMNALFDTAIALAEKDTSDGWNYWIIGSSYGYRAITLAKLGKYLLAINVSSDAMDYLEKACKYPEIRADAALGIGGYDYWRTAKLGILTYLPFVPDKRKAGLSNLHIAEKMSVFSQDAARHALVYIYCEEEKLDSAAMERDYIAAKYPSSVLPLWYNLAIEEKRENIEKIFLAGDELSVALDTLGNEQANNRIYVHHLAAEKAVRLEYWDLVCIHCTAVLAGHLPPKNLEANKKKIEQLTEWAKMAADKGASCHQFK